MSEERYEDFLGPLPTFALDPRQESFLRSVGPVGDAKKVKLDFHLGKVEIANVKRGWPASAPNLGFLQDGMTKLIALGKLNPQSKKEVAQFLGWAVQRVIRTTVSVDSHTTLVQFWTKDDYGTYQYGLSVDLRPES